jgi:hypothetical protein
MTVRARYMPDLMDEASASALMDAMERLLSSDHLKEVWPAASDRKRDGKDIPLDQVDIMALSLDRIGAPAGASGARVFVAYYSFRNGGTVDDLLASPPLVIKMGPRDKLREEYEFTKKWPALRLDIRARFAMPITLDDANPDIAVLIAPFLSDYAPSDDGTRHRVGLDDLWRHLIQPAELKAIIDWDGTGRCIAKALALVDHVHRRNRGHYSRDDSSYWAAYEWYLRDTYAPPGPPSSRAHIPELIFGVDPTVTAFGRKWTNPVMLIRDLMQPSKMHKSTVGAVHGDLHPKNIVLGANEDVHIIDFGWSRSDGPVVVDYLLLDINLRGTTLPSQYGEAAALAMGDFLDENQEPASLNSYLRPRAKLIKEQIWKPLKAKNIVVDWNSEYLIPLFIMAYGLLVHLDAARNQLAMIATVLCAAERIKRGL